MPQRHLGCWECWLIVSDVINSKQKVSDSLSHCHSVHSDTCVLRLNTTHNNVRIDKDKTKAEYEQAMEQYRVWFTTGTKGTRNDNGRKLKSYCEWVGKSPDELLNEYKKARETVDTLHDWQREVRRKILEFYNVLKTQYKINYARQVPNGILAFYSAHAETIKDVTTEFDSAQVPEDEYVFTQDDLRKMFYYADTEEKALLSTAISLGYGSADFLKLEAEKIKNLIREAKDKNLDFIRFVGKTRAKTSIQPRSHLTPETIDSLSEYIELLEKRNGKTPKYLWSNSDTEKHITNQGLNKKFKRIMEKANINTYGKSAHFHLLRKFLYSRLQAKNKDVAKVIVGKAVNISDVTYITDLDAECERVFRETYKEFSLNGDVSGKTKREQSETIEKLEARIKELETFNRLLQQFYTEDIVKRAREALETGKMTIEQYKALKEKLAKHD